MSIQSAETYSHWNFFLALDEDLERIARYIEFSDDNLGCYSLELARTLMMASAEADVVAKQICHQIAPKLKQKDITTYRKTILQRHPEFTEGTVHVFNGRLELHPWEHWSVNESPIWWQANNKVKHERHVHFSQANLKNALNAVAALMLLTLYLYKFQAAEGQLAPSPRIFSAGHPIGVDRMAHNQTQLVYIVPNAA